MHKEFVGNSCHGEIMVREGMANCSGFFNSNFAIEHPHLKELWKAW